MVLKAFGKQVGETAKGFGDSFTSFFSGSDPLEKKILTCARQYLKYEQKIEEIDQKMSAFGSSLDEATPKESWYKKSETNIEINRIIAELSEQLRKKEEDLERFEGTDLDRMKIVNECKILSFKVEMNRGLLVREDLGNKLRFEHHRDTADVYLNSVRLSEYYSRLKDEYRENQDLEILALIQFAKNDYKKFDESIRKLKKDEYDEISQIIKDEIEMPPLNVHPIDGSDIYGPGKNPTIDTIVSGSENGKGFVIVDGFRYDDSSIIDLVRDPVDGKYAQKKPNPSHQQDAPRHDKAAEKHNFQKPTGQDSQQHSKSYAQHPDPEQKSDGGRQENPRQQQYSRQSKLDLQPHPEPQPRSEYRAPDLQPQPDPEKKTEQQPKASQESKADPQPKPDLHSKPIQQPKPEFAGSGQKPNPEPQPKPVQEAKPEYQSKPEPQLNSCQHPEPKYDAPGQSRVNLQKPAEAGGQKPAYQTSDRKPWTSKPEPKPQDGRQEKLKAKSSSPRKTQPQDPKPQDPKPQDQKLHDQKQQPINEGYKSRTQVSGAYDDVLPRQVIAKPERKYLLEGRYHSRSTIVERVKVDILTSYCQSPQLTADNIAGYIVTKYSNELGTRVKLSAGAVDRFLRDRIKTSYCATHKKVEEPQLQSDAKPQDARPKRVRPQGQKQKAAGPSHPYRHHAGQDHASAVYENSPSNWVMGEPERMYLLDGKYDSKQTIFEKVKADIITSYYRSPHLEAGSIAEYIVTKYSNDLEMKVKLSAWAVDTILRHHLRSSYGATHAKIERPA